MNKCALYIPRPGGTSSMVQQGYVDALRCLGWKVYVADPKTKLGCRKFIEEYGVRLILTSSRYGVRQLPVDTINDNGVTVFISALPLNDKEATIGGPYELAHEDEPEIVKDIHSVVIHTPLEVHTWKEYMSGWEQRGINLLHVPVAGNIVCALPSSFSTITDVAMVANFSHRPEIMAQLIVPLFKRLKLLGHSYQAFGDDMWSRAGLDYNGPIIGDTSKLAEIYATARACPNVHTKQQIELNAYINERSFMIPLCGGIQVSDNPLVEKYIDGTVSAKNVTDYITMVMELVENDSDRYHIIRRNLEHVAKNHTYFNRLVDMFRFAGRYEDAGHIRVEGERIAEKHCWEMDLRISAEERGVPYEQVVVGAA